MINKPEVYASKPIPWNRIAVLIPVAGEPDHLIETVQSVLAASAPGITICIIDNGPTHPNSEEIRSKYKFKPVSRAVPGFPDLEKVFCCTLPVGKNIYILEKSEKGKGKALNLGIHFVSSAYIICLDADSILRKDAICNIISPLLDSDEDVFAVGGVILPVMDGSLLCRLQEAEYIKAFFFSRKFFSILKENLLISGAFGAFRRSILINPAIAGYSSECIGEDLELTVKIQSYAAKNHLKNTVRYAQNAVCFTHVPEDLTTLMRQRTRWQCGLIQTFHLYPLTSGRGPRCFAWSYFYLYERISPTVEAIGFILLALNSVINKSSPIILLYFCLFPLVIDIITTLYAGIHYSKISETKKLPSVTVCIIECLFLRPLLLFARLRAEVKEFLHAKVKWK